jgi:chlorinating enzyme
MDHAMPGLQARHVLSEDELARYDRDGFVVPQYRLSASDTQKLQQLTRHLVADNPHMLDQPMACPHVEGNNPSLKTSPGWLDIALNPDIVDMVEQIVGSDIVLFGTNFFYKRPQKGPATPWHRDGASLPVKPLVSMSVWIAVFDSKADNGCLRFIPGSHRSKELGKHHTTYFDTRKAEDEDMLIISDLDRAEFDESTAEDVELEPGQMVLFDIYTIHGARHNLGNRERAGYALRFIPSTSHFDHDAATATHLVGRSHNTRPLILVRGVDRCGLNDFNRGHPVRAQ